MEIIRPKPKQPIPANARRVFQGKIFDAYQWEQELYDGTTAIFEKLKRPDTVIIIPVLDDGKILFARQEQPDKAPFVGLLGGRVEENEDILEAAKRELKEESGYEAKEWLLFDAIQPVSKIEWMIYTFIARNCEPKGEQTLDAGEKIFLQTATFGEFVDIVTSDKFNDRELQIKFLRAKLDPQEMAKLKKLILDL
jgi:8-oxo-dGTP pyrophosphatase MutT (NUDIX family)